MHPQYMQTNPALVSTISSLNIFVSKIAAKGIIYTENSAIHTGKKIYDQLRKYITTSLTGISLLFGWIYNLFIATKSKLNSSSYGKLLKSQNHTSFPHCKVRWKVSSGFNTHEVHE